RELLAPGAVVIKGLVETHAARGCFRAIGQYSTGSRGWARCRDTRSAPLTERAEVSRTLSLPDAADRCAAHPARLAGAVVHHGIELEIAAAALGAHEVAQRAAAQRHRTLQH